MSKKWETITADQVRKGDKLRCRYEHDHGVDAREGGGSVSGLLPTLPGCSPGIVAAVPTGGAGRLRYTLQCGNCHALETPTQLVLMETHFHPRGDDRRRLCKPCRLELFPDCTCDGCRQDRAGRLYQ